MKSLSGTNLSSAGACSRNIGKLFSELKLVPDNLLFIYAEANWEATERKCTVVFASCLQHFREQYDASVEGRNGFGSQF